MSGVSRVSIPNSVRKTIQNIKEIAGNHSDEEIYAMLKECSMDPNETAQKLLFQGSRSPLLHVYFFLADLLNPVSLLLSSYCSLGELGKIFVMVVYGGVGLGGMRPIGEAADTKWRQDLKAGGLGGGREITLPAIHLMQNAHVDAGAGRNVAAIKENGIVLDTDKENSSSSLASQDMDYKAASAENNPLGSTSRSMTNLSNGPSKEVHLSAQQPSLNGITLVEQLASTVKNGGISSAKEEESSSFGDGSSSAVVVSAGVYASTSDPILLASCDGYLAASAGAIKREVGFQPSAVDKNADNAISYEASDSDLSLANEVGAQEKDHPFSSGKIQGNSIEVGGTQVPSVLLSTASTAAVGVSGSRQSSNYGVRSQYPSGHLKGIILCLDEIYTYYC
ncbi:hypothetical protein HPP92_019779 [Vanilla planifolia]|uniref:GBF-interacting protein 1 N-terminal domain-containing protein n=1 Tax=Vanilla planifolia TaxID=51239 RepID=A0A835Q3U8_VANPL|nr:hypothetical protein HPP92_019779 [Vanilla planifolia]